MNREELIRSLAVKNQTKILLVVLDGLGGIPYEDGKTELEVAYTPNLDQLATSSSCGLAIPVLPGITPGSGPAHLSLFGYDPLKYQIGRGILEALGLNMEVRPGDVAVRGNFATLREGKIVDRRAGRIPSEENKKLIEMLSSKIKEIDGVKIILSPGREHRFAMILRGEGLGDAVSDADPQKEGLPPKMPQPLSPSGEKTAAVAEKFIKMATEILKDQPKANTVLLRGFSSHPAIPHMQELFKLNPVAIATYPMYRGLAKLVGMEVAQTGESIEDEINTLEKVWKNYDFFYLHIKKTDSYGEDGKFREKVKIIEEFDGFVPRLLNLKPDVMAVTGDHSTPSKLKSHSWHPVPFLLHSPYTFRDGIREFSEVSCRKGSLGIFYSVDGMALMLANALRLKKFGA